jgi:hypothetical protein
MRERADISSGGNDSKPPDDIRFRGTSFLGLVSPTPRMESAPVFAFRKILENQLKNRNGSDGK